MSIDSIIPESVRTDHNVFVDRMRSQLPQLDDETFAKNRSLLSDTTKDLLPKDMGQILELEWMDNYAKVFIEASKRSQKKIKSESGNPDSFKPTPPGRIVDILRGKNIKSPEDVYETLGELFPLGGWHIGTSAGVYPPELIARLNSPTNKENIYTPEERIAISHVYNMAMTWMPAIVKLSQTPGRLLEFGTGRGNTVAYLATLLPQSEIFSITISEAQFKVASRTIEELGIKNVTLIHGNMLDQDLMKRYVNSADFVGGIEVFSHVKPELQPLFLDIMNATLRNYGEMGITDTPLPNKRRFLDARVVRTYEDMIEWFFTTQNQMYKNFSDHFNVTSWINDSKLIGPFFPDTMKQLRTPAVQQQLIRDYGYVFAKGWTELAMRGFAFAAAYSEYIHAHGVKKNTNNTYISYRNKA